MKIVIIACCLLLVTVSGLKIGNFFTSGQSHISTPDTSGGCEPLCNGSPVHMGPNFSCIGAMNLDCNTTNWLLSGTCLGTFDFVISPEFKVKFTCDGYIDFVIGQQKYKESCGGSILLEYIASQDNILPSYGAINQTCNGTYKQGYLADGQTDPTRAPTPIPSLGKVVEDTAGDQGAIVDLPPTGSTCTIMCNNQEYNGKVCQGDYEMSCDFTDEQETTKYTCTGVFVGNQTNRACIGNQKLVYTYVDYAIIISCTQSSLIDMDTGEVVCEGEYSNKAVTFSSYNIFA